MFVLRSGLRFSFRALEVPETRPPEERDDQILWWHNKSHQLSEILSQWTWNCEQLDLSIMIKKGYNWRLTGYSYLVLSTLSAAEFEMVPSTSYHLPMIMLNFHSLSLFFSCLDFCFVQFKHTISVSVIFSASLSFSL